ncbi:MAG TPA: DUF1592 domain-containing protein [Pirellulales bacterium]|nr:DUF1592 domain-containing protein [Pirellulales bacterium]
MFRVRYLPLLLLLVSVASADEQPTGNQRTAEHAAQAARDKTYRDQVQPLLAKYCIACHGGGEPEADVAFDKLVEPAAAIGQKDAWLKAREYLRSELMPPKGEQQPTPAERKAMIAWIEAQFLGVDCSLARDPGRVTIRRLNRTEYNNTIRDLLGVDFHPADDFPADDVGYGFDHIGDVLSMPPILLEKYLAAAEEIVERAIYVHTPDKTPRQTFVAAKIGHNSGSPHGEKGCWGLSSTGEVYTDVNFAAKGEYILRGRAFGDQAGDELPKMAFRLDGKDVFVADVAAKSGDPATYETKVTVEPGQKRFALAFINDFYQPDNPDPHNRDRNLAIEWLEVQGPLDARPPALPESHQKIIFCQPTGDNVRQCIDKILERFVTRAYRRPARPQEVERLAKFVERAMAEGDSFERGIQLAVEAVLVSPHFLFRIESGRRGGRDGNNDPVQPINDFQLATRLSYFLWSTMPDDELFRDAAAGTLRNNLPAQANRMLRDAKSRALVDNFCMQWLEIRRLKTLTPDTKRFPGFDDELREAMLTETKLFFASIIDEDRSVLDLLDADYTFLNERLARHYGILRVTGPEFRRVQLTDRDRGGVLTQASVLTVTSNPTRTSPVKRGKWVLEQLLGAPPPPPPPGAGELKDDEQVALTGSVRQRTEQHRANPACASCHALMDPLGFGLENFDAVGAWRDRDGAFFVDASGELTDGSKFKGPKELKAILRAKKDDFARCFTEKMLTYALGRGLEPYDKCAVDDIVAALAKDGYKFSMLIQQIVASDPFQKRRVR